MTILRHDGKRATANGRSCFVFVACGAAEHVRELHLSLAALRRHSRAEILVVTEPGRNEIPVEWPAVITAAAPAGFSHHQASIDFKTRLHRLLPPGRRYCYLDTDVFAVGPDVDAIFAAATTPVAFAPDLVRLHEFSPYALRCGCMERNAAERAELETFLAAAYRDPEVAGENPRPGWTPAEFERNAREPPVRLERWLESLEFPKSRSQLGDPLREVWRAFWYESRAPSLRHTERAIRHVERSTGWRRDRRRQSWISPAGNDVYHLQCDHLVAAIRATFGVDVKRPRWQQWNGGVFLFDERGHAFLDAWHAKTMRIFGLPGWRTRDQGTLVATAWEFGLERQPVLPVRFNCILDANKGDTMLAEARDAVTTDAFLTRVQPEFAHVMYRTGDPTWDLWRWVAERAWPQETAR